MRWSNFQDGMIKRSFMMLVGTMLFTLVTACNSTPDIASNSETTPLLTATSEASPDLSGNLPTPTVSASKNSARPDVLILTRAQPSAAADGELTAPGYGKQQHQIIAIDVTDFSSGGTLVIDISLGDGESDGSFDLFPENAVLPTEGRVKNSVAALYDLKHGESGTLTYHFNAGQVFQFGATGTWFSREGATNIFTITATVKPAETTGRAPSIPATELLALRPFKPTDPTLFFPSVYPSDLPLLDANGRPLSEDQARQLLEQFLKVRFPDNPDKVKAGIALYNNPAMFLKISSPTLRAAFAGLMDTVADPAIDFILNAKTSQGNPKVVLVRFSKFPENRSNTIGMAQIGQMGDPEAMTVEINERFQYENPFLFTDTLAHEVLHQGSETNSIVEEEVNYAFDTLVYLELLAHYPEIAQAGTWLSRWKNTNALSRLNSGSGSELGLYDSNGHQPIWPDSDKDTPSFDERFTDNPGRDVSTPGNDLLRQYLERIVEDGNTLPSQIDYSVDLLHWISNNQAEVTPEELIAAAQALKLEILSPNK